MQQDYKSLVPTEEELRKIINTLRELSVYQLDKQGSTFSKKTKSDRSPVTEVDLHSHKVIKALLNHLRPNMNFLSEESSEKLNFKIAEVAPFWCIDPLDGTKDFLKGKDEFAINVAIFAEGAPVWGLVHHPSTQTTLVADKPHDEVYFIKHNHKQKIELPMSANCIDTVLSSASIKLDSKHITDIRTFAPHLANDANILTLSSSYKFLKLFSGAAQAYIRKAPCYIWDVAPGFLAAEIAGLECIYIAKTDNLKLEKVADFVWPGNSLDKLSSFAMFMIPRL